jgi:hypothetical protein
MKTLPWYAVPSLLGATWFVLAAGTVIQLAGLGGALAQLETSSHHIPAHVDDVAEWVVTVVQ